MDGYLLIKCSFFAGNLMSESFAELFEESLKSIDMASGSIVTGVIIDIDKDWVTVHAGLKSEGVIPKIQFVDESGEFKAEVGDEVQVALETVEDGFGLTRLSREKAQRIETWTALEKSQEADEIVSGLITGKVKGGFTVDIKGVRAFLPGSLVDVRPTRETTHLEGKQVEFKLIKLDQKRNNVVVSRRAVLESVNSEERDALLESLEEGAVVKGVVKNLTDYGAFVDLGGIDGLLHITDMAWRRIKHPSEMVEVGQEMDVRILKFDKERSRVSLGLKQLGDDPWVNVVDRYPEGAKTKAKVTNLTDYGCFAELEDGIEGLVHVSEMDWTNKNVHPSKIVQLGDEVEVMVLDIDSERRRVSLGIKQCTMNPWESFAAENAKGDKISGAIKSITDFGIFIGLPGGIDGLVHLSDLSWSESGEDAVRSFTKGDEVEAIILAIDGERERISLGIKQMSDDPYSDFVSTNEKGSIVKGTVTEVDAKGAKINLGDEVEGYIRVSELSQERVEDATTVLKVGDELEAKVINVDRKSRQLNLSIRAREMDEEKNALRELREQEAAQSGPSTIGDLIKAQMESQDK